MYQFGTLLVSQKEHISFRTMVYVSFVRFISMDLMVISGSSSNRSIRLLFVFNILQICLDRRGLPLTERYPLSVRNLLISPVFQPFRSKSRIKNKRCSW